MFGERAVGLCVAVDPAVSWPIGAGGGPVSASVVVCVWFGAPVGGIIGRFRSIGDRLPLVGFVVLGMSVRNFWLQTGK